jgi:sugar lactone lactonase YvrE
MVVGKGATMAEADLRCVVVAGDQVGESPVWSKIDGSVYWTDVCRYLVHQFVVNNETFRTWIFDEPVVALSLSNEPGRWLVALASRLLWWWPKTGRRVDHGFVLPDYPRVRLNDGRADPLGNFWIGSMRNNLLPNGDLTSAGGTDGVMYRIRPTGEVSEHINGLGISNTVCWSPDGGTFYTADTLANAVWAYTFDERNAMLRQRRDFLIGHGEGLPDGSAMDAAGHLWNCRFGGGSVVRVAPNGSIDRIVRLPVLDITSACFGDHDLKTLFITSAAVLQHSGERLSGSLWALRCVTPGLAPNVVKIT